MSSSRCRQGHGICACVRPNGYAKGSAEHVAVCRRELSETVRRGEAVTSECRRVGAKKVFGGAVACLEDPVRRVQQDPSRG